MSVGVMEKQVKNPHLKLVPWSCWLCCSARQMQIPWYEHFALQCWAIQSKCVCCYEALMEVWLNWKCHSKNLLVHFLGKTYWDSGGPSIETATI